MELWIRSQDKGSLMKVDYLYLDGVSKNIIIGYCQSTFTSPKLGTYKTKERALEVLDEIQTKLDGSGKLPSNITDVSKQIFIPPFMVYEMPEN